MSGVSVMMIKTIFCCFILASGVESHRNSIENRINFVVFSQKYPQGRITSFQDDGISDSGCRQDGNISIITHGWLESTDTTWVNDMVREFLDFRGDCVVFMDYSFYTKRPYPNLRSWFWQISDILKRKIMSMGNYENIVMFGFSFGARVVMNVGIDIYEQQKRSIDKIYACDPPGPGFMFYDRDATKAAKFVQCIDTSVDKGTTFYNCHQNWRLGFCGNRQVGAGLYPMGSHGLCPYFFLKSFRHDFVAKNAYNCKSSRQAKDLPNNYIMGVRETRLNYFGDIFAPTSRHSPWNVIEEIYESDNATSSAEEIQSENFADTQIEIEKS